MDKLNSDAARTEYLGERIAIGLAEIAAAIREQTWIFREEDSKDLNSEDTDTIKDEPRKSTHGAGLATDFPTSGGRGENLGAATVGQVTVGAGGGGAVGGSRTYGRVGEPSLFLSHEGIQLMQETPHQFVPRRRLNYESRILWNDRECRICQLRFKNPVHLIQMASLHTED